MPKKRFALHVELQYTKLEHNASTLYKQIRI